MRRVVLGTLLSVMLAVGPLWATEATANMAKAHENQLLLLLPADSVDDFRQALPSGFQQDVTIAQSSDTIAMNGKQYSLIWVAANRFDDLQKEIGGKPFQDDMKVVLSFPQFTHSSPPAAGTICTWEGKDVLFIPYDQVQSFDRSAASGRDIVVVVPYERYLAIASQATPSSSAQASVSPSKEETSAGAIQSKAFPFDRNHVLLLVPADQLKDLSQTSTADRQIFVVMPLDQFKRVADINAIGAQSSAVAPSKEQTSYSAAVQPGTSAPTSTSLPPAYAEPGRTFFLHNAGEANAIDEWYPTAGGTIIVLRDGSMLMVPDSVQIRGSLKQGNRVRGEFEQRDGRNLVTWLEIIPSGGDVQ